MRQLRISNLGGESLGDLESTPFDEGISVGPEEFVQHWCRLSLSLPPLCAVAYIERSQHAVGADVPSLHEDL